jgi:hypothetical protein
VTEAATDAFLTVGIGAGVGAGVRTTCRTCVGAVRTVAAPALALPAKKAMSAAEDTMLKEINGRLMAMWECKGN